eukprot:2997308-Pyramimonas_sp.AAC.1
MHPTAQKTPKPTPRRSQKLPRGSPTYPWRAPRRADRRPRQPQRAPKTAPRALQERPERPTSFTWSQGGPKTGHEASWAAEE